LMPTIRHSHRLENICSELLLRLTIFHVYSFMTSFT
jgi:hypothetical protein